MYHTVIKQSVVKNCLHEFKKFFYKFIALYKLQEEIMYKTQDEI